MNKNLLLLVIAIVISSYGYSQKVKLKKGKVLVDGKEILKYEKQSLGSEITLYSLEDEDEIADFIHDRNGTNSYVEDDFKKLFFSRDEIKIESSRLRARGWKYIIKTLLKNKVLDLEGNIDTEKLKKFAKKYDENITNRTVRY